MNEWSVTERHVSKPLFVTEDQTPYTCVCLLVYERHVVSVDYRDRGRGKGRGAERSNTKRVNGGVKNHV